MCRKNSLWQWLILICVIASLFAALAPFADFDNDGIYDSFITDGLLLLPVLLSIMGLSCRLFVFPPAYNPAPNLLAGPIIPPPISQ